MKGSDILAHVIVIVVIIVDIYLVIDWLSDDAEQLKVCFINDFNDDKYKSCTFIPLRSEK